MLARPHGCRARGCWTLPAVGLQDCGPTMNVGVLLSCAGCHRLLTRQLVRHLLGVQLDEKLVNQVVMVHGLVGKGVRLQ
jgi:hypothetical protein